ncbi:MAG: hypothetical protein B6245_16055, partial [Desulfobacteraceae bacterium 4572_88]
MNGQVIMPESAEKLGSLVIHVKDFLFENQYIMMFYGSLAIHVCPSCCLFMNGQTKNIPDSNGFCGCIRF